MTAINSMTCSNYSELMPAVEHIESEEDEISKINNFINKKYYTDDELNTFFSDSCAHINKHHLLTHLSMQFDETSRKENYNRSAQANISRLVLIVVKKLYQEPPLSQQDLPPSNQAPQTFLRQVLNLTGRLLRYPLYIFTRAFGSANLAISTFTSLDRSFWQPFFPKFTVSFFISLPIDFIFIIITLLQFQRFEGSLFANALKVKHKNEIDPALMADRTIIKVATLLTEELASKREIRSSKRPLDLEVLLLLDRIAKKISNNVLGKLENYKEYKEPWQIKSTRWGFNVIGGFLVCCLNAFTFKYTISAFASSHAVTTLIPWLSAFLNVPAVVMMLTGCAVTYGLVYYSAKRANSPDHYHLKFIHNRLKIETFKKLWTREKLCLKKHHENLINNEIIYRQAIQNRMLFNKNVRSLHGRLYAEVRQKIQRNFFSAPLRERKVISIPSSFDRVVPLAPSNSPANELCTPIHDLNNKCIHSDTLPAAVSRFFSSGASFNDSASSKGCERSYSPNVCQTEAMSGLKETLLLG